MAAQHEVFRDTGWLETHGNMVPDKDKAEEYFTGTPWYEKTCLNEQWKAQRIPPKNIEDVRRFVLAMRATLCGGTPHPAAGCVHCVQKMLWYRISPRSRELPSATVVRAA